MTQSKETAGIGKQFKGNLGLFLVCAELSKWNLIAMPTSRNTKGYDVVVLNPANNKSTAIQVKCSDRRDYPVLASLWRNYEAAIEEAILCDFVFVDIADPDKPAFFVLSAMDLKELLKRQISGVARRHQEKHNVTWDEMLEAERRDKRKPNLWVINLRLIDQHRDGWDVIVNGLSS